MALTELPRHAKGPGYFFALVLIPAFLVAAELWFPPLTWLFALAWVLLCFELAAPAPVSAFSDLRRFDLLWGKSEWLLTLVFVGTQLLFIRDPLVTGRDWQPDLMVAAGNAARLGAGLLGSPAVLGGTALLALAGALTLPRLSGRQALAVGVVALLVVTWLGRLGGLRLGENSLLAVGLGSWWLALTGISEPAVRLGALLLTIGAAIVMHRAAWSAFGSRLGAVIALALIYFNPAGYHYAHVGLFVPLVLLVCALVILLLYRYLNFGTDALPCWAALVVLFLLHPLFLFGLVIFGWAILREEGAVARADRLRLLASAWLAAAGLMLWSGVAGSLPPGFEWHAASPGRFLLPWLAFPHLFTHFLLTVLIAAIFALIANIRAGVALLVALWLMVTVLLVHYGETSLIPILFMQVAFYLTGIAALLAVTWSVDGGMERLGLVWVLGFPLAAALFTGPRQVELWTAVVPGVIILVARLINHLHPRRLPAGAVALVLVLPLLAFDLFGAGAEWTNLLTRDYYYHPWKRVARALRGLPPGTGIYVPMGENPLAFYLAQQGETDRFRIGIRPWTDPERQLVDSLHEVCFVNDLRFLIVPRNNLVVGDVLKYRQTPLGLIQRQFAADRGGFSWPGGSALAGFVEPKLVEELLATDDLRFALRGILQRGFNQLLVFEVVIRDALPGGSQ